MRNKIIWQTMAAIALGAIFLVSIMVHAENIDPNNDDSQYAYGENAGWLNAEPLGDSGPGIEVEDSRLTGYMWGENIGWVSLSCENRSSCSTVDYGVTNDGNGNLSGYAWSENAGWISFSCDNTGNCATVDYGVTIDPITGEFSGKAWGENIGWISFNSTGAVAFGITAAWTPPTGDLNVDIVPQGAIDGGAKWKLTSGPDTSWKESGDTITDLPVGVYTIRFKNTYGWVKPANQVLNIIGGITNSATGTYTQITTVGSVSATIEPQGAIDDGAKWKLTSGPDTSWKDSGDVISSLAVGTYTVSFKNTYGWVKPANQSIEVTDGMTATTTGTYTQISAVGSASATIEPQGAIDDGAKWKLTSGPDTSWKGSGDVISSLAVGTYTVSFKNTYGWVKPANQSIEVTDGMTATTTGTYSQISAVGSASTTIEPQGAIDDGAKWKLTSGPDTSWKDSGDVISSLAVGTYTVSFKNTYGWVKPANQSIEVTDGMTAATTGTYTEITAVGSASATIEPQGAIDEGAKWKLTSGPDTSWKDSGDVISSLAVGTYTVSFKNTYGWVKPANQSIEVTDGMTATTTGTYTQISAVGSASATIEPQGAIDDGAKWKLTSGPDTSWKDSGDVISSLAVGTYTVSFKNTYGWVKPTNQSIEVTDGTTATTTGTYTEITAVGSASATIEPQGAIDDGAKWKLTSGPDTSWKDNGDVISSLAIGTYTVSCKNTYGWIKPANQSIEVTDGTTTTTTVTYTQITAVGSASATIEPQGAIDDGAKWKLTSGPDTSWKDSGDIISSLAVGTYTVSFKNTYGWVKPANQSIEVTDGMTTTTTGTYTQITAVGSASTTIEPQGAIDDGAKWKLTSGPDTSWKDSGDVISSLAVGTYTVRFKNIEGWIKPVNQSIEVTEGATTSVTGTYHNLNIGLVAHYPFNGNANDETGNGYDGTVIGPTLCNDRFGNTESGYCFDGANDYISIGQQPDLPSWDTYSVSVWFLNNGGGNQSNSYGQKIIDKTVFWHDFNLRVYPGGVPAPWPGALAWGTYEGGGGGIFDNSYDYRDNLWHHVVINKSGSYGELWIDGNLFGTSTIIKTVYSSGDLLIGYSHSTDSLQRRYWSGKIDDIRFYDRVLSDVEIQELYGDYSQ